MCGRYTIEIDEKEIRDIIEEVERKRGASIKTGEIYPTNPAPVLMQVENEISADRMVWGYPKFRSKGVLINARAETAAGKRTFSKSLLARRYVIPSTGFFEWTQEREKKKYKFNLPDLPVLYMAGLYNEYEGTPRYVILTTAANASMRDVHDRMPVVLEKQAIQDWILRPERTEEILYSTPPALRKTLMG